MRSITIALILLIALNCFAQTEIKVGNLSYSIEKNTKPIEHAPAAISYEKESSPWHIINVRFPGYKYFFAINGSGWYPGWSGLRNTSTGVITVTSPKGYSYIFDNGDPNYNEEGMTLKLTQINDPNGDSKGIYTYDGNGRVYQVIENNDPCSVYMQFDYDVNGRLESITGIDPSVSVSSPNYSRTYTLVYDANDRVVSTTASGGGCGCGGTGEDWLVDVYDANGILTAQKDNTDLTIYSYSYHPNGELYEKKDKENNTIKRIELEDLPNDTKVMKGYDYIDPYVYRYSETVWGTDGYVESESVFKELRDDRVDPNLYDSNCFTTSYAHNGTTETIIPDGGAINGTRTVRNYDSDHNLTSEDQYDSNNNYRTIVSNSYSYGRLYSTSDIRGNFTTYEYDGQSAILNKKWLYNYEHYYRYFYNNQNRRITEEFKENDLSVDDEYDPVIQTIHYEYDIYGNVCKEYRNGISDRSDANSFITEYIYNAFGNLVWQISPDGVVLGKTYDGAGRVESEFVLAGGLDAFEDITDPLDVTLGSLEVVSQTNYQYNSVNGKVAMISTAVDDEPFTYDNPAAWSTTVYGYDSYGRKTSETRDYLGLNITTAYQYNAQDEIEIVTHPDSHIEQTVCDGRGLTIATVESADGNSVVTTYEYDNRGNLVETAIGQTVVSSFEYDDYGRKTADYSGTLQSGRYIEYIYDGDTDDVEIRKVWDDSVLIGQTFNVYDIYGRVIFEQQFANPTQGNGTNDNITFYRYDILGNLTMTAFKGEGNYFYGDPYFGGYDYYADEYGDSDGDIVELRKYNDNLQLEAVIKFDVPEILDTFYDEVLQDYVWDFFDANLAITQEYIKTNDSIVSYLKYSYVNSQPVKQSIYKGLVEDELTFKTLISYEYDDAGRAIKVTDADDNFTTIGYDSRNNQTANTLWQGKPVLRFNDETEDPNFVPYSVRRTLTAYNKAGLQEKMAILYDPNINIGINDVNTAVDKVITYVYNSAGKIFREKEVFGKNEIDENRIAVKEYTYDALGRLEWIYIGEYFKIDWIQLEYTEPLKCIGYQYDDMGRQTVKIDWDVNTYDYSYGEYNTYFGYDDQGRVTQVDNASGTLNRYFYDTLGRKVKEINSAGMVTNYNYNGLGYLTSTVEDANNTPRTTTFGYDRNGQKTSIGSGGSTTYYDYNHLRKIDFIEYPGDKTIEYGYDVEGNVISRIVEENTVTLTTHYKRDALGRICYKQYSDDPNWLDPNTFLPFDEILYNAAGNKEMIACIDDTNDIEFSMYSYNGLGNLVNSGESYSQFGYNISYGYDNRGLLISLTYPDEKVVEFNRDALGRVDRVSYNGSVVADYYYQGDKVVKKFIGDIEYSAVIDALGRIDAESYGGLTFDYGYLNHTHRLTSRNSISYTYDTLGRVTGETGSSYNCDLLGNPTNAGEDNFTYALDNEDRVAEVDDAGGTFAEYAYDRTGRRTRKTVDEITTYFAYDKFGNIIAEYIEDGNDIVWQKDYIYGASGELVYMQLPQTTEMGEAAELLGSFCDAWLCYPSCTQDDLYWDLDQDDQVNFVDWALIDVNDFVGIFATNNRYILTDFKGSVVGIAYPGGSLTAEIAYNAWGTPSYTGNLDGLNILWNGYYFDDETGNYYLRNRYYSPLERRFVTEDPRGINPDGNWSNPFNIDDQYGEGYGLLVYCKGDAVNNADPFGLISFGPLDVDWKINWDECYPSGSVSVTLSTSLTPKIFSWFGGTSASISVNGNLDWNDSITSPEKCVTKDSPWKFSYKIYRSGRLGAASKFEGKAPDIGVAGTSEASLYYSAWHDWGYKVNVSGSGWATYRRWIRCRCAEVKMESSLGISHRANVFAGGTAVAGALVVAEAEAAAAILRGALEVGRLAFP